MEEQRIVVLEEGVDAAHVAEAAACCPSGSPTSLRAGPEPDA